MVKKQKNAKATEVNLEDDQEDETEDALTTVQKLTREKYKKNTQR